MAKILSFIITIFFLIIGLTLGVLNPSSVPFDLFFFQTDIPLSILLAIALVIGMLIGSLYTLSQLVKLRWQVKRLEKDNKKQLDNIVQLKKEAVTAKSLASEKTAKPELTAIESN